MIKRYIVDDSGGEVDSSGNDSSVTDSGGEVDEAIRMEVTPAGTCRIPRPYVPNLNKQKAVLGFFGPNLLNTAA